MAPSSRKASTRSGSPFWSFPATVTAKETLLQGCRSGLRLRLARCRAVTRRSARPWSNDGLSALLNDIDAGIAAIAFHAEPGRVARKPCVLQRHVLERAQAMPALLAVFPVAIGPILRRRAGNDQIETTAVGCPVQSDVRRRVPLPVMCSPPSETVLRTHGQNLRFLLELPRTLANKRVQLFEAIL